MAGSHVPPGKTATFPRQARVRARSEFDAVFTKGRRSATPMLSVHVLGDDQPARLGLAVSRKVDTRAVVRNRIKRILRDTFRRQRHGLAGGAYVVVARAPSATASPAALRAAFNDALRRAGAFRTPGTGTMPASDPPPPAAASAPTDATSTPAP